MADFYRELGHLFGVALTPSNPEDGRRAIPAALSVARLRQMGRTAGAAIRQASDGVRDALKPYPSPRNDG